MKKFIIVCITLIFAFDLYAQQENSEELFRRGLESWENADYVTAKNLMRQVAGMASASPGLREEAQEMIDRCNDKLIDVHLSKDAATLEISEASLQFSSVGDFKEITVISNLDWSVIAKPEWCDVVEKGVRYMKIRCDENTDPKIRPGQIVIRAGTLTRDIFIYQDAHEAEKGRVFFRVSPNNVYVESSDGTVGYSSSPLVLKQGKYNIRLSKEGYEPKDTVINITEVEDTVRNYDFNLKPLYGKLHPVFKDEDGRMLKNVDFKIGRASIDLDDYANSHSYDDKETIEYYGLYRDGTIPLNPGVYDIFASVPGYETVASKVVINKGEYVDFEYTLKSNMGYIVVREGRNAEGARISVSDIGVMAEIGDTIQVPVGKHQVEVLKDSYLLDSGVLDVTVNKDQVTEVYATMTRMVELLVSTDLGGERLYINGTQVKYQEPYHRVELSEGEEYEIDIRKKGYWHTYRKIEVMPGDTLYDMRDIKLQTVDTIRIKANEPDLTIKLYRKDTPDYDYAENKRTPVVKGEYTDLVIPHGKYKLQLYRTNESKKNRRLAYSGDINFTPDKDRFHVQTWMTTSLASMRFIGITGYLADLKVSEKVDSHLPVLGSINFFEVALVKGLSTSLVKGTILNSTDMVFPHGISDIAGKTSNVMTYLTCMLLNYDFRIGGYSFRFADANVLVSYSYSPVLKRFEENFGWTHYAGHDLFVGLEACTRMKAINANLRIGFQYMNGERAYYVHDYEYDNDVWYGYRTNWRYECYPLSRTSFVIGLNINVGAGGAKGANIWRVF